MRRVVIFLLLGFGLVLCAQAQNPIEERFLVHKGHSLEGDVMYVNYELPYNGMVEFRLMSEEGELLYFVQQMQEVGENYIRFKTTPLEAGQYKYSITFKDIATEDGFYLSK